MQVAVVPVGVVERSVDEVVDVGPVRDGLVAAPGSVPLGALDRRAGRGVAPVDLDRVLVHLSLVSALAVKVPVVEVVGVVPVPDGRVATPGSVPVLVSHVVTVIRGTGHADSSRVRIVSPRGNGVNGERRRA